MKCSILLLAAFLFFGCSGIEDEKTNGERIVSISPSVTATVVAIGAGDKIVGRSAFCTSVDKTIPVVGDLYEIDYERLLRLQPTKVFVQETAAGIDSHLLELANQSFFTLHAWKCDRVNEIVYMHDSMLQLLDIDSELLQITLQGSQPALPGTFLIMTPGAENNAGLSFGKETYLDDVLQLMGGTNAIESTGWVSLTLEDISKLNPTTIVIVSDSQFAVSKGILSLDIPVISFIHSEVLVPSSRITEVARELQQQLLAQ
jgi:iron complex transport system substrate-binding protein